MPEHFASMPLTPPLETSINTSTQHKAIPKAGSSEIEVDRPRGRSNERLHELLRELQFDDQSMLSSSDQPIAGKTRQLALESTRALSRSPSDLIAPSRDNPSSLNYRSLSDASDTSMQGSDNSTISIKPRRRRAKRDSKNPLR